MSALAFKVSEVLSAGWKGLKNNFFIMIVLILISFAVNFISRALIGDLPFVIFYIINLVFSAYIMLSIVKACLKIVKGEKPGWDVLKNDMNSYLKFLGLNLIFSLILFVSALLLILPVFLAMAVIFPTQYMIVDKNITIKNAYKRSWDITTKNYFPCMIYVFLSLLIILAGTLLLGIGLLIALPIVLISGAEAYKKLDHSLPFEVETTPLSTPATEVPVKTE